MPAGKFVAYGILILVLATGCATTQVSGNKKFGFDFTSLDKVAVIAIEGALESEAAKQQLTDMMNQQLLGKGYSPIERQQMLAVMQERDFQTTSITGAAQLGKVLNVGAVIIANVPSYENQMSMSAKMISVTDNSILWTANGTADTGQGAATLLSGIGGAIGGGLIGGAAGGNTGAIIGGATGGTLAAVGGAALSPQKAEQANKLVTELFNSLPPRVAELATPVSTTECVNDFETLNVIN